MLFKENHRYCLWYTVSTGRGAGCKFGYEAQEAQRKLMLEVIIYMEERNPFFTDSYLAR